MLRALKWTGITTIGLGGLVLIIVCGLISYDWAAGARNWTYLERSSGELLGAEPSLTFGKCKEIVRNQTKNVDDIDQIKRTIKKYGDTDNFSFLMIHISCGYRCNSTGQTCWLELPEKLIIDKVRNDIYE